MGKGEEPGTVGRHGLANRNESGQRKLEFCEKKYPLPIEHLL
jgi:hypothetical protein